MHGQVLTFPSSLACHTYIYKFLPTTATSTASYFTTSLIFFNLCLKGEIQEDGTREKIFLAKDRSSQSPNCCLRCWSQNVSPRASGHALPFCRGTTALPGPSPLVFIILDRLSMCLIKKHFDNAAYLINSACIAQDGKTVGMKARKRIGNKPPDSISTLG